ncbi:hypothetical protein JOC34_002314 [Virgibacillus halotolerans]|uniref:hypothetical protein n=1 Tax=Virgibacillus halotolerans TaxID=1071053 RepID=UPI00195FDBDC|nr:hypothetical protein [Virgibacillus halotolerans]MBM7599923.1 hypothetical protein [Virgibacillus halotolerans]
MIATTQDPLLTTLLVTLIVAILAQLLSHFLTTIRDRKSYFMQRNQNLYSNVMVFMSNYMAIKTNPKKNHDVHDNIVENDLLEITIEKLNENIKYSSLDLLRIYERFIGYGYFELGRGDSEEADKHTLVYFLIEDLIKYSKWTRIYSRSDRKRLKQQKYYYGLCAISLYFFEMEQAETILQMENWTGKHKTKFPSLREELLTLDTNMMTKSLLEHLTPVDDANNRMYSGIIDELKKY